MDLKKLIYIFIIISLVYYLISQRKTKMVETLDASNAAEMCKEISSEAENISAAMGGVSNILDSALAFLSPNNYKSGSNTANNMVRNILDTKIAPESRTRIENECNNAVASNQSNIVDQTQCKYCDTHNCAITNLQQVNDATVRQDCLINNAVVELMKVSSDIQAAATADLLQKASGPLTGDNKASNKNCNIVNKDISPKTYLDIITKCANAASIDQSNTFKGCGTATNVLQKNVMESLQECIIGNTVSKTSEIEDKTKIESKLKVEQSTELIGLGSLLSICSCSIVSIVSILMIGVLGLTGMDTAKEMAKEQGGMPGAEGMPDMQGMQGMDMQGM